MRVLPYPLTLFGGRVGNCSLLSIIKNHDRVVGESTRDSIHQMYIIE